MRPLGGAAKESRTGDTCLPRVWKERMLWGAGLLRLLGEGAFVASFDLGRQLTSRVTRGNRCPPNLEHKLDSDLGT